MKSSMFLDVTPCSPSLTTCFTLFSSLAYFWTLRLKAIYSSETYVGFQRTTQGYIKKYITLIPYYFPFLRILSTICVPLVLPFYFAFSLSLFLMVYVLFYSFFFVTFVSSYVFYHSLFYLMLSYLTSYFLFVSAFLFIYVFIYFYFSSFPFFLSICVSFQNDYFSSA
jgi:hypothetical protein